MSPRLRSLHGFLRKFFAHLDNRKRGPPNFIHRLRTLLQVRLKLLNNWMYGRPKVAQTWHFFTNLHQKTTQQPTRDRRKISGLFRVCSQDSCHMFFLRNLMVNLWFNPLSKTKDHNRSSPKWSNFVAMFVACHTSFSTTHWTVFQNNAILFS